MSSRARSKRILVFGRALRWAMRGIGVGWVARAWWYCCASAATSGFPPIYRLPNICAPAPRLAAHVSSTGAAGCCMSYPIR